MTVLTLTFGTDKPCSSDENLLNKLKYFFGNAEIKNNDLNIINPWRYLYNQYKK